MLELPLLKQALPIVALRLATNHLPRFALQALHSWPSKPSSRYCQATARCCCSSWKQTLLLVLLLQLVLLLLVLLLLLLDWKQLALLLLLMLLLVLPARHDWPLTLSML